MKPGDNSKKLTLAEFQKRLNTREPMLTEIDTARLIREIREEREEYLGLLVDALLKNKNARPN